MLVHDLLRASTARSPDRTAVVCSDRPFSFSAIDGASDRLAGGLRELGIRRGDRVALLLDNSIDMVVGIFGVLKAGAVFIPLNPTTKADKLAYILNDCGVRAMIASGALAPVAGAAAAAAPTLGISIWADGGHGLEGASLADILARDRPGPADPGLIDADLAAIIYTSGSTGRPKGVMLTHRNLHNTTWSISSYLGNEPGDVVLCVLPLSFDYGLYQILTGARVGFTVVLEKSFAYPYRLLQQMTRWRVSGLPGVPTIFARLLELAEFDHAGLPSLRYVTNTAAAWPPAHIRRLQTLFPAARVFSMYGLTECTRVSYLDPERLADKIGSVGRPIPNSEAYVVGPDGRRLGPHQVGELVVRGANVMRGYWGKPAETAERLKDGEIPGEKVLHTGDLFRLDEEGFLYFVGRKDDVFKCRGEKVSPKEIEHVLYELDAVADALVLGVDDAVDGKAIKALVVPRPGAELTPQAVRLHCRGRLESHLVPKFIELVAALPKSDNGKIMRRDPAVAVEAGSCAE